MSTLFNNFRRLFRKGAPRRKRGQTLVEYALVLAVLTILALGVFSALGNQVAILFTGIDAILDTAQASG